MNTTPQANRLHIAIYGRRNAGKSSLLNAITGQELSIVSEHAGTTADPVFKAMEIPGIGPCVFIDTAGFDDSGIWENYAYKRRSRPCPVRILR